MLLCFLFLYFPVQMSTCTCRTSCFALLSLPSTWTSQKLPHRRRLRCVFVSFNLDVAQGCSSFIYRLHNVPFIPSSPSLLTLRSSSFNLPPLSSRLQRCWSHQRAVSPETPAATSTTTLWPSCWKTQKVSRTRQIYSTSSSKTSEIHLYGAVLWPIRHRSKHFSNMRIFFLLSIKFRLFSTQSRVPELHASSLVF